MTLAIGGRQKLSFISETAKVPAATSQEFESWLSQDQLVRSWLINSMEPKLQRIFQYSDSALNMWKAVRELYGDLNNSARVFQIKKDLAELKKGNQTFIEHLGNFKAKWNELDLYRPHTTDSKTILKRVEEDKIFQLLYSLGPDYEDLQSHILMSPELPTLTAVCQTIQREETRRKVMSADVAVSVAEPTITESRAFVSTRPYKGRRPDLKCSHCERIGRHGIGHTKETCWLLHPELKPKSLGGERGKMRVAYAPKANIASNTVSEEVVDYSTNPINLINEFASFLQQKQGSSAGGNATAMLGKFAGFLAESHLAEPDDIPGIMCCLSTALDLSKTGNFWIVDSGASDHMSNDSSVLNDFHSFDKPSFVSIANGNRVPVIGTGKLSLFSKTINSSVMYVPDFPFKLLSVGKITRLLDCLAIFSPHNIIFQDRVTKKMIGEGFYLNGLYYISTSSSFSKSLIADSPSSSLQNLWHLRLAHPSFHVMSFLFPNICKPLHECETCHKSKSSRLAFPISVSRASRPFEIVHSDVWGPAKIVSFDGFRYYVTFIDDFSRNTFVYLLKFKHEVQKCFEDFHNLVKNHFSSNICILRSDNGTEFTSNVMQNYLSNQGILHQTSCVGTPQQNGIAERKNRDLLEKTRAIMLHANVPKRFWSHAIQTAAYIINRLPSRVLNFKSPFEVLRGKTGGFEHLRVFGCVCFVHIQASHRGKLDARAAKCVLLGYSSTQKGYKCYDPTLRKLYVTRDVRFDESTFFFQKSEDSSEGELFDSTTPTVPAIEPRTTCPREGKELEPEKNAEADVTEHNHEPRENVSDHITHEEAGDHEEEVVEDNFQSQTHQERREASESRYPSRARKLPSKYEGFEMYTHKYPRCNAIYPGKISPAHYVFLTKLSEQVDPKTFEEASSSQTWKQAMRDEFQALNDNGTWSVVPLPKGRKVVGSRWIFKTKYHSDGSIERHKARLVARGFTQTFGVDYKETFAPVAKMNTVRVLLSVAINHGWSLFQMDVKNAFLHGDLEEDVFMKIPQGHPQEHEPGMVCKLHKAIYGLKQSPRAWYAKLSAVLCNSGFKCSDADSSMFIRTGKFGRLVVLVYVDDLIITGDNIEEINSLKLSLHQTFAIKDLGQLRYFLGIELDYSAKGLFLNQRKYVLDLLDEANMQTCSTKKSPLPSHLKLEHDGQVMQDITVYQRLVGKLIYLTITRPDIAYAVSIASQFMHAPTSDHLQLVKRILRYLKGSITRGIFMSNNGHFALEGFSDSDWAGNSLDRKSTTGYCTFVGGNLVTWKSKKQTVVARSSAEAEYRAMASTACELIWLKALLSDMGIQSSKPITLHCDNQAAMHIAANPVFHERTKHIEVDCHFVRHQVQSKVIQTVYVRSCDQLADLFTKVLPTAQLERLLGKLGSRSSLDTSLRGSVEDTHKTHKL